ncbi:MAG: hypothetical protein A2144_09305 [Chloroflexi bacterium RBG_16_50_9]|nr:MAG: hypothetical protein A2144_09305 [Chloroflexi bacterium RBG_16_50_9]
MEAEKKLTTLEQELKLLKGELKQSLASVRDYLLNMELPNSEISTILASLGSADNQKITLDGNLISKMMPKDKDEEEPVEETPEETPEETIEPEPELTGDEETDELEESPVLDSEPSLEEETSMEYARINPEASQATPRVNLMANLIGWVAKAKKDIGYKQLPTFLEVYGLSGHLSAELKEAILQLAEITSEREENNNASEIWTQSMLSLHGILTGGDAPLQAVKPFWHNAESETKPGEEKVNETVIDEPKESPFKLKLVLPGGDGKSQEFCLDLKPEAPGNGSQVTPKHKIKK